MGPSDAAPLGRPVFLMVREIPPGDTATEFGRGVRTSTGIPYLSWKASASSGSSGAVPEMTDLMLPRSAGSRSAASTVRNAAGTRLTVTGRCRFTASSHSSIWNFSSRQNARPSHTHCSTRKTPLRCTIGAFTMATPDRSFKLRRAGSLVMLGAAQHPLKRLVRQRNSLRRPGRAAGEHFHRDAGIPRPGAVEGLTAERERLARRRRSRGAPREAPPRPAPRGRRARPAMIGRSSAARSARTRSMPRSGLIATMQAPARKQADENADLCWSVAQQNAHPGAGLDVPSHLVSGLRRAPPRCTSFRLNSSAFAIEIKREDVR